MARNKMNDLRDHLFETLEKLKDGEIDVEKAKTVAQIGQVLVNSAKVEVDFMRKLDISKSPTGFLESSAPIDPRPAPRDLAEHEQNGHRKN